MNRINAVILDWAGTTVDFGSFAPTQIFVEAFRQGHVGFRNAADTGVQDACCDLIGAELLQRAENGTM